MLDLHYDCDLQKRIEKTATDVVELAKTVAEDNDITIQNALTAINVAVTLSKKG